MSKSTFWCLTINNYSIDTFSQFEHKDIIYCIGGFEVGDSGTKHIQGFVQFKNRKMLSGVKKIFPTAHLEVKRGTVQQAIDYCKKDGDWFQHGDIPLEQHVKGGEANKRKWEDAWELAKKGRFEEIEPKIRFRHYSTAKQIHKDFMVAAANLDNIDNEWIYGESGVGKSRSVQEKYPDSYKKMANKWWDGYQDEEVVLIEDIDKKHEVLGHHLKIWGDHYNFIAEIKGGARNIRPKKIIITSNYHPKDIWSDENMLQPILRRFKVHHMERISSLGKGLGVRQVSLIEQSKDNIHREINLPVRVPILFNGYNQEEIDAQNLLYNIDPTKI